MFGFNSVSSILFHSCTPLHLFQYNEVIVSIACSIVQLDVRDVDLARSTLIVENNFSYLGAFLLQRSQELL